MKLLKSIANNILGRLKKILQNHVIFEKNTRMDLVTTLGGYNKIYENTILVRSHIGVGTYIGPNSFVCNASIGNYCSIGPNLYTLSGRHPIEIFVSTHPAFFSVQGQAGFSFVKKNKFTEYKYIDEHSKICIQIKNDVWIGANVTIAEGVTIGNGSVIGANSLVLHDVEDFSVVAGSPAKFLKKRFDDKIIMELIRLEWWNKGIDWLRLNSIHFDNIENFLNKVKNNND